MMISAMTTQPADAAMLESASAELSQKLMQPIRFQWGTGGADQGARYSDLPTYHAEIFEDESGNKVFRDPRSGEIRPVSDFSASCVEITPTPETPVHLSNVTLPQSDNAHD